jgi:hypothetical protein
MLDIPCFQNMECLATQLIKTIMKKIYLTFTLLLGFGFLSAQDSKNYQPNLPDYSAKKIDSIPFAPPPPPNPIPIDGGVGFLIVAGVGYGLKRMRKK